MTRPDDIRKEILMQAYAVRPLAVSAERIYRDAKKAGYDFSLFEIKRELPFLVGEKLLFENQTPGVTERTFEISSIGVRHYENTYAA
ncbi:MAG: hypothetical protein H7Y43_07995 [Akkermansiaceae bacterium]|nr:hypothetical protein [Verrucomicrobiales bacterium]